MSDQLNRLTSLQRNEQRMTDVYRSLLDGIRGVLLRYRSGSGTIPYVYSSGVRQKCSDLVTSTFLGLHPSQGSYVIANDQFVPTSAYTKALWAGVVEVTTIAVAEHSSIIRECLVDEPEVLRRLSKATIVPTLLRTTVHSLVRQTEDAYDPFIPNLASYDQFHTWLDANNRTYSDRIWRVTGDTRRQMDLYLTDAIASGRSAADMSIDLENFLIPGRELIRTNKPYGSDASYDGMRLARTEITAAHTRASHAAAMMNAFVDTYTIRLSPSHVDYDECDEMAAGSPYVKTDTAHLPPFHPMCMDFVVWNRAQNVDEIARQLRQSVVGAKESLYNENKSSSEWLDTIGPLMIQKFAQLLLNPRL
jgi:hypothetical protein